ncbi:MAG: hypothetical protein HYZ14_02460 [Bacteroidetes bacterium]|nr:hypothetical protein [Bacteroidota bacterium]
MIFLVISRTLVFGSEGKEVLHAIRANYENLKSFQSDMSYAIYRGFESATPVEEYSGYFCSSEKGSYRRIHQSEFFNFSAEGIFLQVDHRDQSMYLANAVNENLFEADLEKSLKICSNIIVSHTGNSLVVSLILGKMHDLPYNRIDLDVSEDFWIQRITLFYAAKANFSKNYNQPDMDQVRMEIAYLNFNKSWKDSEGKLDAANYLSFINESYEPSKLYKNYSIVDLRK